MALTKKDFDDLKSEFDGETTAIAARIDALVAQQQSGSLTATEEQAVFDEFKSISAQLKALGTTPAPPVTPVP